MKNLCKRLAAAAMTLTLALGLAVPAMAYTTPDFADLPANNWAYAPVMRMADQGIIQGTGGGNFSPEVKVSAAQFLTLVGRIVFPETKVGEGDTWYSPYMAAAQSNGLLTGTQVDVNQPGAEITRYDMAVVLRAAVKKLGKTETLAQQSQVTDFGMIPNMYTEAVLAVYGMGLIKGDQTGKFNGGNTMRRNELATVIDRLVSLKNAEGTTNSKPIGPDVTDPEPPIYTQEPFEPEIVPMPDGEEMVKYRIRFRAMQTDHVIGRPVDAKHTFLSDVPIKIYYTPDGGKTSILVAECKSPSQEEYTSARSKLFRIIFEAPERWSRESTTSGSGFYVSAETMLDGQRLVTSDLRTDGRAYLDIQQLKPLDEVNAPNTWNIYDIEFTPPEGEKAHFTFQGYVEGGNFAKDSPDYRLPNFTVRLYLANGTLLGETVSKADGTFSMDCEVDALDDGFSATKAIYYVTAFGEYNGSKYEVPSTLTTGELDLLPLHRLEVCDEIGQISASGAFRVNVYDFWRVEQ